MAEIIGFTLIVLIPVALIVAYIRGYIRYDGKGPPHKNCYGDWEEDLP